MRNEIARTNFSDQADMERTCWNDSQSESQTDEEMRRSVLSSLVAPNLVDSRYSSVEIDSGEESAEPKPEISHGLYASGWEKYSRVN